MFSTRDFFLFLTTVAFLLVAIGTTFIKQNYAPDQEDTPLVFVDSEEVEYTAEVAVADTMTREERLEQMRAKIADSVDVYLTAPEPEPVSGEPEETAIAVEITEPLLCPNYQPFSKPWPVSEIKTDFVEGARVYYTESTKVVMVREHATATPEAQTELTKDILLQIPARSFSQGGQNCIAEDVVGVAMDGSLIRNNEAGLYGVFGPTTVVGYALDGYPIYGQASLATDSCGGATQNGTYGYYLSADRSSIINCFTARPTQI